MAFSISIRRARSTKTDFYIDFAVRFWYNLALPTFTTALLAFVGREAFLSSLACWNDPTFNTDTLPMTIKFVAQQKTLGLTECGRLCARWSRDLEELASRSGWHGMSGQPFNVPVGAAINMLVLSIAMTHGVELQAMAEWLPGLRNEALLQLGQDTSNWSFDGASEAQQQFWDTLYGRPDAVRPRIAPMLKCCPNVTTRQLRFEVAP